MKSTAGVVSAILALAFASPVWADCHHGDGGQQSDGGQPSHTDGGPHNQTPEVDSGLAPIVLTGLGAALLMLKGRRRK
jgi:hypothetical protein